MDRPHFVESTHAGSRKDTAVLLVGTAREFGIDQHSIQPAPGGFRITTELRDVLLAEASEAAKKTSGNRAAKKPTTKE